MLIVATSYVGYAVLYSVMSNISQNTNPFEFWMLLDGQSAFICALFDENSKSQVNWRKKWVLVKTLTPNAKLIRHDNSNNGCFLHT